ncbi:MAG TPA: SIMPL domain-containing protein [Anaerolineae bacterium]|nr:SIMPL domain-containing protein [Anaerolineae bacterium]
MKDKVFGLGAAGLLLILALSAWTQQEPTRDAPRTITVAGEAEVRVVPDEVILTLGIETWDKDLERAKGQNDAIVARVLALATEHGVPAQHVQTDYVSIEPRYKDGYYEQRDFVGYFVRKNVVVTLRDLAQFEPLLSDALEAGVNYVHGVEFRTTELRAHKDDARALAIEAAREKAVALAGGLDEAVSQPLTIVEEQAGSWSSYNAWWGGMWGGGMTQNVIQEVGGAGYLADSTVAPGQIEVTARVSVTFALSD